MISTVMTEITNPNPEFRGNIVLLHDSGGDRSKTVQVLGALIDTLRAKGYKLVPVSELAGLTRDQAMPPLSPTIALMTDRVVFLSLSWLGQAFTICFMIAIVLGIARLIVLCGLAFWNR